MATALQEKFRTPEIDILARVLNHLGSQRMDRREVQTLFRQFAAPLAAYAATSPERKELAEMLARNLWTVMIAGPQMESQTWEVLKTTGKLDDDSLQMVQHLYFDEIKASVTNEQVAKLRQRYQLSQKERA